LHIHNSIYLFSCAWSPYYFEILRIMAFSHIYSTLLWFGIVFLDLADIKESWNKCGSGIHASFNSIYITYKKSFSLNIHNSIYLCSCSMITLLFWNIENNGIYSTFLCFGIVFPDLADIKESWNKCVYGIHAEWIQGWQKSKYHRNLFPITKVSTIVLC
jgi:hypothetical protein